MLSGTYSSLYCLFLLRAAPDVTFFFDNRVKLGGVYLNEDCWEFCCYEVLGTFLGLGSLTLV